MGLSSPHRPFRAQGAGEVNKQERNNRVTVQCWYKASNHCGCDESGYLANLVTPRKGTAAKRGGNKQLGLITPER
jgi:hypothetical protein